MKEFCTCGNWLLLLLHRSCRSYFRGILPTKLYSATPYSLAALIESAGIQATRTNLSNDITHIAVVVVVVVASHTHTHASLPVLFCFRSVYTGSPGSQIIISVIIEQADQHHPQGRNALAGSYFQIQRYYRLAPFFFQLRFFYYFVAQNQFYYSFPKSGLKK